MMWNFGFYVQISVLKGTHHNASYQETSTTNSCDKANLPIKKVRHQMLLGMPRCFVCF